MATIRGAAGNLVLLHTELLGQGALQTSRVEGCKRSHLSGLQAAVEQSDQTCEVGRIEDDDNVLHVGAISLDVLAKLLCNLAVAGKEVFASHASLTGCATAGNDVLGILESLGNIGGCSEIHAIVATVEHLFHHTLHSGSVNVVETYVRSEAHSERCLHHCRTDGTASTNDHKLVIR